MLPDEIQPFSHTISDLQVRRVCCKFYTRLLQFVNRTPGARNLYSQGSTGEKVLNCFLPLRLQSKEKWPFLNSNILLSCHPCMRALCRSSRVRLFVTPWIAALQAPLSMEVFRARILGRVAMPSCRASSRPRISHGSSTAGRFFTAEPAGEPTMSYTRTQKAMSVHCSFSTRPHGTVSCLTYSSLQPFLFCFCLENIQSFLPSLHAVTSIPNPIVLPNALPSE